MTNCVRQAVISLPLCHTRWVIAAKTIESNAQFLLINKTIRVKLRYGAKSWCVMAYMVIVAKKYPCSLDIILKLLKGANRPPYLLGLNPNCTLEQILKLRRGAKQPPCSLELKPTCTLQLILKLRTGEKRPPCSLQRMLKLSTVAKRPLVHRSKNQLVSWSYY